MLLLGGCSVVAEEKRANVFICMQHFGKFLKSYFFLFQPGPQLELTLGLAEAGGREGRQQGKGLPPLCYHGYHPYLSLHSLLKLLRR